MYWVLPKKNYAGRRERRKSRVTKKNWGQKGGNYSSKKIRGTTPSRSRERLGNKAGVKDAAKNGKKHSLHHSTAKVLPGPWEEMGA